MLVSILHYQIKKYWDDKFRIILYELLIKIIFSAINFFVLRLIFIIFKINDGKCLDTCTFELSEIYFCLKSDTSMITGINDSLSHINE